MQQLFVSIYRFFNRRKAMLWLLFTAICGLCTFLALRLDYRQDISAMLPDSKGLKAMNNILSHSQAGEQLIFMAALKDSTATDPDSLINAIATLEDEVFKPCKKWIDTIQYQPGAGLEEALPDVFKDYLPVFLTEQDYTEIEKLLRPEVIDSTLEKNRKILLSPAGIVYKRVVATDPVGISALVWKKLKTLQVDSSYENYNGYLFSDQLRKLNFFVKPANKSAATGQNSKFFKALNGLLASWQVKHPGVRVTYFGGPAVAAGNAAQMQQDTIVTLSVTIVLLMMVTWYYFRRKRVAVLLLLPVVFGAIFGLAVVYLVQGYISLIALGGGAIIMGIAIDFSIHFFAHDRHAENPEETIKELVHPLTIGSFTTVAAFLALQLVHTPVLHDLGLFAAASLAGAVICTLIFLPHCSPGGQKKQLPDTLFDKLGRLQPEKNKWLLLGILLITPVMLYYSFGVQFDDDLMNLNYMSPQLKKAQDEVLSANSFALSSIYVVAGAGSEDNALQKLEEVVPAFDEMAGKGWIKSVSAPVVFIPSLKEQQRRIDRWNRFWAGDRAGQIVQILLVKATEHGYADNAFASYGDVLQKQYQPLNDGAIQLFKTFYPGNFATDGEKHFAIASLKVPAQYRDSVFATLSPQQEVIVTDKRQGANQLVALLNNDFQNIALYSSLIVFFALLIGYGRIELALMSFLPMAVAWIWILGLMALLGLKFNIVNIIISSLIFGLGDDYSIFTTDGLLEQYQFGTSKLRSVRSGVYLSVATVIIGLGVLILAKHPALRSIAFTSVLGIVCVVFISQTLQPFLFNFFVQRRADKQQLPFTLWSFIKAIFAFLYFVVGCMILGVTGFFLTKIFPGKEKGRYLFHSLLSRYTGSLVTLMANTRKVWLGMDNVDFSSPAVYVANHTSFLDILVTVMLNPRLVLLTNKWVYNSPFFGYVIRMAEYYPVAEGVDDLVPLKSLVDRGYSILVFPEGTRSVDGEIKRFHKGAFYIAEKLKLDIVPVLLHGLHQLMPKKDWLLKDGTATIKVYPRITQEDNTFGSTYSERAKLMARWMRKELSIMREQNETPSFFRYQLLRSYTYKGPVLEWYCRVKTAMEGNYEVFHKLLPREGRFYDLGCGYGFMSYMLHMAAPKRDITGIDYDEEKIATAQHNLLKDDDINFARADLRQVVLEACDGIIISDVLHYLLPAEQEQLMEQAISVIAAGGILIIRDGVEDLEERHKGTKLTELFSTRLLQFNKTTNELHFISRKLIADFAARHHLVMEVIDNTKNTSNLIFVLRKGKNA